jgi:hypothetical protein
MKSFFKKLSLVLAAAMVITMLPAQIAKAAPTALKIRKDSQAKAEATVAPTYNLMVGDQIDITFDGATGYDAAAKLTKKWTSKDKTVATVDGNGLIKALKPGTTTITITCTAKGVDYQGTATVNVTDSKVEVKQTKYNEVAVIFATEGDASSAKANVKAYLVQRGANGVTRLRDARANVAIDATNKNVINVSGLADGLEYQIAVPGVANNFTVNMKVGAPYEITLYYPVVNVGKGNDLKGDPITSKTSVPEVEVLDANGIVVNFETAKLTFKSLEKKGNANLSTSGSTKGQVTFTNGNTESEMKVQVTYKYIDAAKKEQTLTATAYAQADAYTAPKLGGWAESIVATDKTGDKVVYDDNFYVELNVNEERSLAYYFLGDDGKKYTGSNVRNTAACATSGKEIYNIGNADYYFYFEKDNTDATFVSLTNRAAQQSGTTKIKAWKSGEEDISLYRAKDKANPNSAVDTYLGTIHVKVNAEAVIDNIAVEENTITGFKDAYKDAVENKRVVEIDFTTSSQYQKAIKATIAVKPVAGVQDGGVTISQQPGTDGKGKVKFDFDKINFTGTDNPITVTLYAPYTDVSQEITVYSLNVDKNVAADYALVVDSKKATVKNVNFKDATSVSELVLGLKIARTYSGSLDDYVDFKLVRDDFENDAQCTAAENQQFYVVVYDSTGKPVEADKNGAIPLRTATGASAAVNTKVFNFDIFADNAETVSAGLIAPGMYKVVAYKVEGGYAQNLGDYTVVEVVNDLKLIEKVDSTYVLERDGEKVKTTETKVETSKGAISKELVKTIIGELYGFYDKNSDGKAQDGEIDTILALTNGVFTIDWDQSKYYAGSDGSAGVTVKEMYIKYVTINFKTGNGNWVQQRIDVDRKFVIE